MRANQAAIQRRVNTPRVQPQSSQSSYGNGASTPSMQNSYAPYPPQNASYGQNMQTSQQQQQQQQIQSSSNVQTPNSGKMPAGLNPQQQLQFILNVLGDRISKLEMNVAQLSNQPFSSDPQSQQNSAASLQNAIASHPEIKNLKDSITQLQSLTAPLPIQSSVSNNNNDEVITEIQANIDTLFTHVEHNEALSRIQEELQTRTELLVTEINQVKDMVLQLQSTVINTLVPAIIPTTPALGLVSTLESFTEAPLNIIPQDPSVAAAALEENLENAELPTITEPLTYQEL